MGRPRSFDEATAVGLAARVFAASGYEGTSVDDLVRGLGIHRGSLYQAFGSKRALYLRVLREHVDGLEAGDGVDLRLLLRAAVERAPVDRAVARLVADGFQRLSDDLPSSTHRTLAELLGAQVIARATPGSITEEEP